MNICIAQTRPEPGDIAQNIRNHESILGLAAAYQADYVFFPELSLTGYEPERAEQLATTKDDSRLDVFQSISNTQQLTIGLGLPIADPEGVSIGMVIFQAEKERQTYRKQHLHADEEPYFISDSVSSDQLEGLPGIALAICYEISVPEHAQQAHASGAETYVASVAKVASGVGEANQVLPNTAQEYGMNVFMANCIGPCDGSTGAGQSAVWNAKGQKIGGLNDVDEGIILMNTETQDCIVKTIR
ncbi:carbon-nitrogen hydrolase family protein [Fodinibius salsisoli]|uniref:Carbon-nitrogen hydrolase family protein n=1 Tax=Fodinibius salsisoli TaxID=2820877 RepID=A0ABT3PKC3_9BACT|nr:carbon-nitrogen hydrolase family protein [Fodinibius salsisoli]MCW9706395.1 carbon-nitrogen hydrolase family protein [Fodinibius salsisoli]